MKRWKVNVGFMVPHYASIVVEAETEEEARGLAMARAAKRDLDYQPDVQASGPLQTFDVFRAMPGDVVTSKEGGAEMGPKEGDIIHVKAKVIAVAHHVCDVRIHITNSLTAWVSISEIVHIEPAPLKVGDVVSFKPPCLDHTCPATEDAS